MKAATKIHRRKTFVKGEAIFIQGDPSDHAYFVQQGSVMLTKRSERGTIPFATIGPKQVIGEMALLDEDWRPMTAVAREATTCIVILRNEFKYKLQDTDPMVRALLKVMARNITAANPVVPGKKLSLD